MLFLSLQAIWKTEVVVCLGYNYSRIIICFFFLSAERFLLFYLLYFILLFFSKLTFWGFNNLVD